MKKTIPRLPARLALLVLVLAVSVLCRPAYAEDSGVSTRIPLSVQAAEGSSAENAVSYFGITAENDAPLPLQSTLCIRGEGTDSFGPIGYTVPGDYVYTVRQTSAAAIFRRDPTVYTVTVRIVNNDRGTLNAEVWAVADDNRDGKVSRLVFTAVPLSAATAATATPAKAAKADAARTETAIRRAPQTGDASSPLLVVLCCIGSAGAAVVLYRRHKAG